MLKHASDKTAPAGRGVRITSRCIQADVKIVS